MELITPKIINKHECYFREERKCLSSPNIVYCLYNNLSKLFKIGYTERRLQTRINALQNQSGIELELFFAFNVKKDYKALSYEKAIHFILRSRRGLGEWFNLSISEALEILNSLQMIEGLYEVNIDMQDLIDAEIDAEIDEY